MIGLDRAGVYVELENVEADLIILGIRKKFPQAEPRKLAGATQTFKINTRNINEIRVTDRFYKVLVRIDFSYPRYFDDDNLIPLATDIQKQEVENNLCELIYEISLQKFKREFLFYDYFELCTQENIQSFYSYHNIISLFYKALKRKNDVKIGTRYEDYDLNSDFFYSTGFSFQMTPGWKIKLYNKTIEHNKHNEEKIKGGTIRLEHRLTRSLIIRYCGDSKVSNIKISDLKNMIVNQLSPILFSYLKQELERDVGILYKNFKAFTSTELTSLVRDYQEHILDEKIINYVVSKNSNKSRAQIFRYRKKIREALAQYQSRGSPKRQNFGNIERLEIFLNKILLLNKKVKFNYEDGLTFSVT